MNKYLILILLSVLSLEARGGDGGGRGGGGGGRGGGGGGARSGGAGRSIDRTPSMSRSAPQRAAQGRRQIDASRAQTRATQTNINRSVQPSINRSSRNATFQAQARRQATPEQTAQFRNSWNQSRSNNRRNIDGERSAFYNRHPGYNNWFNNDFYSRYNQHPAYWNANANYWRRNGWGDYNSWLGYGWNSPYYYDDSDGLYYNYDNYQPDVQVTTVSATIPQPNDWYPLGIFALSSAPDTSSSSNFIYQLAVNQQGQVEGTLYNTSTQLVYDVEGTLNKDTQVVSFRVANDTAPVMSTGLFNLTQDQTQILVQFVNGSEQTWTLTRLSEQNSN